MSLEVKAFPVTFASGATATNGVDLGKAYSNYYLEIQSATTFQLAVQGSSDNSTWKRIYNAVSDGDNSTTYVEVNSAMAGPGGAIVKLPVGVQYMRLESLTAVANGMTCKFICVD